MQVQEVKSRLQHIPEKRLPDLGKALLKLIDTAVTATPKGSFYNDEKESVTATKDVHRAVFDEDRGLYALSLLVPGVLDWSKQLAAVSLLDNPPNGAAFLSAQEEWMVLERLVYTLPIQRRLKLFVAMKDLRVNNSRTRKIILDGIVRDPQIEWHALKYRRKLRAAITHALGKRRASIIRSILDKPGQSRTSDENDILYSNLNALSTIMLSVQDSISFILGNKAKHVESLIRYDEANSNPELLKDLPPEVAEGKRSTFFPQVAISRVVEQTKDKMTKNQVINSQRSAARKGVEVAFDPAKYDSFRLYLYAYEQGMDAKIAQALEKNAIKTAEKLSLRFPRLAIILDTSASMAGSGTQRMRPMALALALRDTLLQTAEKAAVYSSSPAATGSLPVPQGDTALAKLFLMAMESNEFDAVIVISDGYENSPAGRFNEVVTRLRQMGVETPVYQFSPVFAAESSGVRKLASGVPVMAVPPDIKAIESGFMRIALESDFYQGISMLANSVDQQREIFHG